VNRALADELARRYAVDPIVVMNCPPFVQVGRPGQMRRTLDLGDQFVLLYHGAVAEGRGIEVAIEALKRLAPNVHLVVLGEGGLVPWVQQQQEQTELAGRLHWHPPVPLSELLSWVVDADLGLALIAPTEGNFVISTPNKLFECMTAGVPILASDFPEMRRIVRDSAGGEVCDPTDPDLVATTIQRLLADPTRLAALGRGAAESARTTYNWDAQVAPLVGLYQRIVPVDPTTRVAA
jgi:glycosyltransferase involved in cell wall biosynthesis